MSTTTKAQREIYDKIDQEEMKKINIDKVVAARAMVSFVGWRFVDWDEDGNFIVGDMKKNEVIEFKKFWREIGAEVYSKWLWKHKLALANQNKDGDIVVMFMDKTRKKGNRVVWNNKKSKEMWLKVDRVLEGNEGKETK